MPSKPASCASKQTTDVPNEQANEGSMQLVGRVRAMFAKRDFLRSVTLMAGGTAAGQAIVILTAPLITRFYSPDDFGQLSVYTAFLFTLLAVASWRYELAMPLPKDDVSAANVLALCLLILAGMTGLVGAAALLFGNQLANLLGAPALGPYLILLAVSLFGAGLYQILNFWVMRRSLFRHIAQTKISQSFSQVLVQVGLGLLNWGLLGLILGDVAGRAGGSGTLLRLTWQNDKESLRQVSWQGIRQAARQYAHFPLFSSWATLLNRAASQAPAILITALYGAQIAGYFALTLKVTFVPLGLIALAIAQVYFSKITQAARENSPQLEKLFWQVVRQLFFISLLPTAFLLLLGPWSFRLVFGPTWEPAGSYAQMLSLMFIGQFVVMPVTQTLNALQAQGMQLIWDATRFILAVGGLLVPYWLKADAATAIMVYGMLMAGCYLWYLLLCWWAIKHRKLASPDDGLVEMLEVSQG